jgi:hypothetical protein
MIVRVGTPHALSCGVDSVNRNRRTVVQPVVGNALALNANHAHLHVLFALLLLLLELLTLLLLPLHHSCRH